MQKKCIDLADLRMLNHVSNRNDRSERGFAQILARNERGFAQVSYLHEWGFAL